jgi:hypothetical protein
MLYKKHQLFRDGEVIATKLTRNRGPLHVATLTISGIEEQQQQRFKTCADKIKWREN